MLADHEYLCPRCGMVVPSLEDLARHWQEEHAIGDRGRVGGRVGGGTAGIGVGGRVGVVIEGERGATLCAES